MKKYFPIILGIIFLSVGLFLYVNKPEEKMIINEPEKILTKEEASSLIGEKIKSLINVYERPNEIFNIEENANEDGSVSKKVTNYQEVVTNLFSENGIKQLENTKFNGKNYVIKNNDIISLLDKIPVENSYVNSKINLEMVDVKENVITSQVIFSSNSLDSNDVINYYVINKNIKLIKIEDKWYVDDFNYNNA